MLVKIARDQCEWLENSIANVNCTVTLFVHLWQASDFQYFYDSARDSCFPFKYSGCGGTGNKFDSHVNCMLSCMPADKIDCAGQAPAVAACDQSRKCPAGTTCLFGYTTDQANNFDCGGKTVVVSHSHCNSVFSKKFAMLQKGKYDIL
ncbi:Kunitz/Bovine pancreatic trypsin inhibitor domain protein [Cooperia oncophora]